MTSEACLVQDEEIQDYTPAAISLAGEVNQLEDGRAIVTVKDLVASQLGAVALEGIFDLIAGSSVVFDKGETVLWDVSANTAIKMGSQDVGDFPVGIAIAAKASGALKVRVDLNAVADRGQLVGAIVAAGAATGVSSTAEAIMASFSISAASLRVGNVVSILAQIIATATHSTDTFQFRLRIGGVAGSVIADTGAIDLADNDTGILKAAIVIRTTGASGTMVAAGESRLKTTNAHTVLGSTAIDTTAAIVVCLTCQCSASDAGNSARADIFNVTRH